LISDQPRTAGKHRETWDGKDLAGVVDIAAQRNFHLFADGVSLWHPSIIVDSGQPGYAEYRHRVTGQPVKPGPQLSDVGRTRASLARPHDITPEPRFTLTIPAAARSSDGLPIVSGTVRLQVALDEKVRIPVIERRFEIVPFFCCACLGIYRKRFWKWPCLTSEPVRLFSLDEAAT
jgi:hypothetical protein